MGIEIDDEDDRMEPGEVGSDGTAIAAARAGDMSWIERVRKERDERVEDESLKLGMPTWGPADFPDLVAEFGVLPRPQLERFQREASKKRKKGQTGASDTDIGFLVAACRAIYFRNPETQELIKLAKDDQPIRFDKRLSETLNLDPEGPGKNSQSLLLYLVKDNGVALGALALKVARWMTNTSAEVEDAILGE